jgi:cytochrome c biogenesis protein ResB
MIALRPMRYYKPYSVTLQKFTHERYAGTEIPKNFASRVTLSDPERIVNRDVLIYMNHPLRYRGETFYQAGFQKDDQATILQVVHNPSFIALTPRALLSQPDCRVIRITLSASRKRRTALA